MRVPKFLRRMIERRRYRYEADINAGGRTSRIRLVAISAPRDEGGRSVAEQQARVTALETGRRVLFIDSHIRRPNGQTGLAQVLLGTTRVREALERTELATLWKLPSGSAETPARELLESMRMRQLIEAIGAGEGGFHAVFIHLPRGTWRRPAWLPK